MSPDSNGKGHGRLLQTIADNDGITGAELGLKLGMAPPLVSEKISGLEKDGMIRRERDSHDRRCIHIYITHEGTMALARRSFGQKRFRDRIDQCLSAEECVQFCSMCSRIIEGVKEMREEDWNAVSDESIINFYEKQKQRRRDDRKEGDRASENR